VGNNGVGVVGVNWIASIMGAKFADATGSGTTANAINAIEFTIQAKAAFAATSGANVRVLSNSWGGGGFSQALLDEINRANSNDMLFVAAAGNDGTDNDVAPVYPASYDVPNVMAVAATDNNDMLAVFPVGASNYGATSVHLGAPGLNILSTLIAGGYSYDSGTSMATPHVSGAAALVLSKCALTTANLKTNLLNNVDPIPSLSGLTVTGGRLNVNKAIRACRAPGTAGFAYVANYASNNVSAYSINGTTGALREIREFGSPFPAGFHPRSVTVDPTGRFAYVANEFSNNVSAYTIDGTIGALISNVPGSPFPAGGFPQSVTVDPTGRFAYVANCGESVCGSLALGNVSAYTIDGTTGALISNVPNSPFPARTGPLSVTVDPTGQFAYVAHVRSGNVSAYTINGTTGALTEIADSPFPAGGDPHSVTVDPTGQFTYVANCGSGAGICGGGGFGTVSAYTINGTTGALREIREFGSPFPAGALSFSVTVDPTGRFAYVANCGIFCVFGGLGDVSAYTIDGTMGALREIREFGSPFPAGTGPVSVTVDPTGRFAYVANQGSNNVSAYTIDGTTGALISNVPDSPSPAGIGPVSVTTTAGPLPPPATAARK
jgi:DNA-binding beta-propeller fold protein YncE